MIKNHLKFKEHWTLLSNAWAIFNLPFFSQDVGYGRSGGKISNSLKFFEEELYYLYDLHDFEYPQGITKVRQDEREDIGLEEQGDKCPDRHASRKLFIYFEAYLKVFQASDNVQCYP